MPPKIPSTPTLQRSNTSIQPSHWQHTIHTPLPPPRRAQSTSTHPERAKQDTQISDTDSPEKHKSAKRAKSVLRFVANPIGEFDRKRTKRKAKKLEKALDSADALDFLKTLGAADPRNPFGDHAVVEDGDEDPFGDEAEVQGGDEDDDGWSDKAVVGLRERV